MSTKENELERSEVVVREWEVSQGIYGEFIGIANIESLLHFWDKPSFSSVQFSSVAQSCSTLCNPMNRSTPGLPVHHHLRLMSIESVMPSSHPILGRPLLLLPPIPPSIRVFSNSTLQVLGTH